MEAKVDQKKLAEDVSSKIKYEFTRMFLAKPLEPVKVKKEITTPIATEKTEPVKDDAGVEARDYDTKTEVKEVDADYRRAVVLKVPYEYAKQVEDDRYITAPISVGDIVIYKDGTTRYFDLFKDSVLIDAYSIVAKEA